MLKRVFLLAFAAAAVTGAFAQKRTVELTLDKAVAIALDDNPTIKIADLDIERYDYVKKQSESSLWPSLSGTAGYTRSIVQQTMSGLKFGADNTFSGGLALSVPIIAPGIWRNVSLSKEQMVGAVESARGSRIELVASVKDTYYQVLLMRQSIEVLQANETSVAATVNDIQQKYNSGLASEFDLISAQVQLSNFHPQIIEAQNGLQSLTMLLKMYLNLPADVEVVADGTLEEMKNAALASQNGLPTDLSQNSNLRMLDIQKDVLERQLKLVNSQRMPTLAAFGQAQLIGMDNRQIDFATMMGSVADYWGLPPLPSTPPSKYTYNWQNPVSVGLSLSVPIFAGRTIDWQARQVQTGLKQIELQKQYAEQGMNLQLTNAINSMAAASDKMAANGKVVEQAQRGYSIAKVRYGSGAGTMLELSNAENLLTQAQLNYNSSIYDFLSARTIYEKTTGIEK